MLESTVSPWRFSSKRVDEETGWSYFGRRYYDASWGRWTTADPTWYADGSNLYAYVHNNPHRYCDPDGLSAVDQHQGDQLYNTHQGHGTFLGSYASHYIDDTTWGLSSMAFGKYECDNWPSRLGATLGTASSMAVGLIYGGTEAKILKYAAGTLGKCGTKIAKYANFFAKEVKQVSKAEGTTLKVVENVAPQFEKTVKNTSKGGNLVHTGGAPKKMPDGHMWDSGSPFRGKTAEELHEMFKSKGYELKELTAFQGKRIM